LAGISEQASRLVRWLAHQLRLKADVGSLFFTTSRLPWWTWIFQFGGPTKVDLLIERWETSVASDDADVRTAVVDALRRVVRNSGWHVRAGRAPIIIRECGSALGALGNIRDDRALADLDWFIGLEHAPYKQPLPAFFWRPLEQRLFERAREVAVEIRQNAASST
jgi:hypothetical protein